VTLSIGRATGLEVRSIQRSGDRVNIEGHVFGSESKVAAVIQQINGMLDNPDEPVFPVVWQSDPTLDGFYFVTAANAELRRPHGSSGAADYAVTLRRLPGGFQTPSFEVAASSVVRSNSLGVVNDEPNSISMWADADSPTHSAGTTSGYIRPAEGNASIICDVQTAPFLVYGTRFASPAKHYRTACRIEVNLGGTWYPIVGQQVPFDSIGKWRISNGLVRYTGEAAGGRVKMEVWKYGDPAGSWVTVATWRFGIHSGGNFGESFHSAGFSGVGTDPVVNPQMTVLRNSPETVVLRWARRNQTLDTLTLNAGDYFAEFLKTGETTFGSAVHAVQSVEDIPTENIPVGSIWSGSPGRRASADSVDGARVCIVRTATAWTPYTTKAGMYLNAATPRVAWCLGAGFNFAAFGGFTAATICEQIAQNFVGSKSWVMRPVQR
jgi:hypothetical protein